MKMELKVITGVNKGMKYVFDRHDTFLVGRAKEAHFRFPESDLYISRRHFLLEVNPPICHLKHLSKTNPTVVNGNEVTECTIKSGDRIEIGFTTMTAEMLKSVRCIDCGTEIDSPAPRGEKICAACREKAQRKRQVAKKRQEAGQPVAICVDCGCAIAPGARAKSGRPRCARCLNKQAEQLLRQILGGLKGGADKRKPVYGAPRIKGYEIVNRLGKGGMGEVWLAKDVKGKKVAVKTILPKAAADEHCLKVFQREIEVTAGLKHPRIVGLLDHGFALGQFYFVMEYIEGTDADKLLRRRGGLIPLKEAVPIILQVLEGLEYTHKKNIVHRDIKPANILLKETAGGWDATLSDFGLAKNFQMAGMSGITLGGQFAGSYPFMPPEQIINYREVKPVSDIFAIGATLYCLVSGKFAYEIKNFRNAPREIIEGEPVGIRHRNPGIPRALAAVIDKSVSKQAAKRYKDAGQMRLALKQVV